MSDIVLPFNKVSEDQTHIFGGKSANLAKLIQNNLPVPNGFAVGLGAFNDEGKLNEDAKMQIVELIESDKLYAVRSSALAEDAEGASWAGQFETFLNTKAEDVIGMIEECHNSLKSRAKSYAKENDTNDFDIAVAVQEMLKPAYAGVLFTRNPISGENQLITEYIKGLGEDLVSGKADPVNLVLSSEEADQAPFDGKQLADLSRQVEQLFGMPQDIEWAWAKGKIWLLQARPITTIEPSENTIMDLDDALIRMVDLFEKWGISSDQWILTGQYVYRLLGYDVSVRAGHHNVIINTDAIPWEFQEDALEVYPTSSAYADEYQKFIKDTGHEFDLLPVKSAAFKIKQKDSEAYDISDGRTIYVQTVLAQLKVLEDILDKSDQAGWGIEKGKRILGLVEEVKGELTKAGKTDLVKAHEKVVEKFSFLKTEFSVDEIVEFLGAADDLFYWGPTRAKPEYMSDFMAAAEKFFVNMYEAPELPSPPKALALFAEGKNVWLLNAKAFADFTEKTFEAYSKRDQLSQDYANWQKATEELSGLTGLELEDKLVATWLHTEFAEFSLYGAEAALIKRLSRFDAPTRQDIWSAFTVPDKPTFLAQLDTELTASQDPQAMAEKYPWIQDGYDGLSKGAAEYFEKRLKVVGSEQQSSQSFKSRRDELIQKLKLSDDEVKFLTLTRKLAEFMDDRKGWMMQSRRLITKSIGSIKHGWFFNDGRASQIGEDETYELWQRYVDFKVSTSAVVGVVASNGGKHFVNGDIVIVTSPTEAVADGKIVVVPSTSPSYVPLMRKAKALVTDHGGMMSHAAIVAREFNLPCIVGTKQATKVLKNGDKVILDLIKGEITK